MSKKIIPLILIALAGCTFINKNQGECGVRYGTEITFFHRAAQTAPEPATLETRVPSLDEWIKRRSETPPVPETEPQNMTPAETKR